MNKYLTDLRQEFDRAYNLFINSCEKLNNNDFISKAPIDIVNKTLKQKEDSLQKIQTVTSELNRYITDMLELVNKLNKNVSI